MRRAASRERSTATAALGSRAAASNACEREQHDHRELDRLQEAGGGGRDAEHERGDDGETGGERVQRRSDRGRACSRVGGLRQPVLGAPQLGCRAVEPSGDGELSRPVEHRDGDRRQVGARDR